MATSDCAAGMQKFLSPKVIGHILGVKAESVIRFVRAGWLTGVNCALPGATRERWRFTLQDLETFRARR